MISDAIHEAIHEIEQYQAELPEAYDAHREHIDMVKAVMGSLQEALDQPTFDFGLWYEKLLNTHLTDEQRERWRVWCEAGIARWAERLRLLGPVPERDLLKRIRSATERQGVMLNGDETEGEESPRQDFLTCLYVWSFLDDIMPVKRRLEPTLAALSADGGVMPVDACDWLGVPAGSTYAEGVRAVSDRTARREKASFPQSARR